MLHGFMEYLAVYVAALLAAMSPTLFSVPDTEIVSKGGPPPVSQQVLDDQEARGGTVPLRCITRIVLDDGTIIERGMVAGTNPTDKAEILAVAAKNPNMFCREITEGE